LLGKRLKFALADMRIFQRQFTVGASQMTLELWALSPSQHENSLAKKRLGALLQAPFQPQMRIPDVNPNHTSVAAALLVGPHQILLGGRP
jgi:hypothetical protein